ncbi:MAG: hypothetical protein ACE14W_07215 [Candidatus Velamenicoccus archaeovorus]
MAEITEQAEREMVRRAVLPSAAAVASALAIGWATGGAGAGASAAIGVALVFANFAAHGLSLAWASTVSITVVQVVALGGFVVRLGVIVAVMFALNALSWFSPLAFGLAVVPATLLLLAYEARLALRGMGTALRVPADPAAAHAAEVRAARETR